MSGSSKRRLSRDEWARVIDQYRASGQGVEEFCRARSLKRNRFMHWLKMLGGESQSRRTPGRSAFIEVPTLSGPGGWEIELDLGDGMALRLRRSDVLS